MRKAMIAGLVALLGTSALAQTARDVLPIPEAPFDGVIAGNVADSKPGTPRPVRAPQGAPNIFLFMSDDVGYSMTSAFGGPVPTPNLERIAAQGQRYNRFHTTGICSPTRASLLTGRNPHVANTALVTDLASEYPGYNGRIPTNTATIAQMLRLNGYNTAMFGKHHNVPQSEMSPAGPFDHWPTGLGFEYFFGLMGGDTNQWHPALYRGTSRLADPAKPQLMDKSIADEAIRWLHNQNAAAPDKPWFLYFAPNSAHAPLMAPPELVARFKGQFNQGWDKVREETYARQLKMGIIPASAKLTARPAQIPSWDSQSPKMKAFGARQMEVAAAMLAYQDEQLGRVLAEAERMGEMKNTLVILINGDNGASAEGGPTGTVNEIGKITSGNGEGEDFLASQTEKLGGDQTYPGYAAGWAWAMNTPLRWTKQYASMLGAVRNGMIMSWPGKVANPGGICARFGHVNDMVPTILEAAGLPAPKSVYGVEQKPFDGQSLISSLSTCEPNKPRTQYFEITGKIALYKDGWLASNDDDRVPWGNLPTGGTRPETIWSLYDLTKDFSQADDVSVANPAKLNDMSELWKETATKNNVYPLDHRFGPVRSGMPRFSQKVFDYWGNDVSIPAMNGPTFAMRSFAIDAELRLDSAKSSGVVLALGSLFGGFSLYLDNGRPAFHYAASTKPEAIKSIIAAKPLLKGETRLRLEVTSEGFMKGIRFTLLSGGQKLAEGRTDTALLIPAGLGEALDTGRDTGALVTPYRTPHGELQGEVRHVRITFK